MNLAAAGEDRPVLSGQRVLFVVPVAPAFTGNGLAMRCAHLLQAIHDEGAAIRLVIIPAYQPHDPSPTPAITALCRAWSCHPAPVSMWRSRIEDWWRGKWSNQTNPLWPTTVQTRWRRQVERVLSETTDDLLVVFRLSAFSFLSRRRTEQLPCWLDLDELDSERLHRQAKLAVTNGAHDESRRLEREACRVAKMERDLLPRPRWLSVSSDVERAHLPPTGHASIFILPNTVSPRPLLPLRENKNGPFRCLFVGSFGHPPNVDAVVHFCREILPRLQKLCARPVEFIVAGPDPDRRLASLEGTPNLRLLGWVDDLTPVYRDSDIVVVPLRAASGTRLKILEAFTCGRPIVSTPLGAEGLNVTSGRELLLAPDSETFAQACATLLADPAQQTRLAAEALAYVTRHHHPNALRHALRGISPSEPAPSL